MRYRGRRWNNMLILAVIVFIAILNLPTLIKTYLLEPPQSNYPMLLDSRYPVVALYSREWSLNYHDGDWVSNPKLVIEPLELVQNWKHLAGTLVDDATYQSLKPQLKSPQTLEVWYDGVEEPQRITFYQLPQFWLFKNGQQQWLAVSADRSYLFPSPQSQ